MGAGVVVVLKQDAALQDLVPALDLALGLRVAGSTRMWVMPSPLSHSARSPAMVLEPLSLSSRSRCRTST